MFKTIQELYNTSVVGLASQGFKQSRSAIDGACLFRGTEGRKCAAGHLIPDEFNANIREGSFGTLGSKVLLAMGIEPLDEETAYGGYVLPKDPKVQEFMSQLIIAHDQGITPNQMRINLAHLAVRYELTIPAGVDLSLQGEVDPAVPMYYPVTKEEVPF